MFPLVRKLRQDLADTINVCTGRKLSANEMKLATSDPAPHVTYAGDVRRRVTYASTEEGITKTVCWEQLGLKQDPVTLDLIPAIKNIYSCTSKYAPDGMLQARWEINRMSGREERIYEFYGLPTLRVRG
jgi:hypothetical protein